MDAWSLTHVVDAVDAGAGIADRGFTFLGSDGAETFLSYDALRRDAMRRASAFADLGLGKGDRVALVLPDGRDFVPTFLGALWRGVVPVPLYPPASLGKLDAYQETLAQILARAKPRVLVAPEKLVGLLWPVVGRIPSIESVVSAESFARAAPRAELPPASFEPGDLCFLQFTSGSTSTPKGVMVSHASLRANCLAIARDGAKMTASDVAVSWLPLFHDMGLIGFVLAPLFAKASVVLMPTTSFVKNASLWMETVHRKRGTLSFAPNFAYALAARRARPEQLARWDLSCLRLLGCGAEPIQPKTLRTFAQTFAPAGLKPEALLPAYGMAEATLAVSFAALAEPFATDTIDADAYERRRVAHPAAPDARAWEVVSCGRPFPGHEIAAMGRDGARLPERVVGELALRGPSVTLGYYEDPDATAAAYRDGWLYTGDLGYLAAGEVFITGRRKDIVILNGRNHDPQSIEWIANEVPGIKAGSAVAFSRPGRDSEELVVCAELRSTTPDLVRAALVGKLNEQLQVVPADVLLLPSGTLPRTSSGKLQRQRTRTLYLQGMLGQGRPRPHSFRVARHVAASWAGRARHTARELWRGAQHLLGREAAQE